MVVVVVVAVVDAVVVAEEVEVVAVVVIITTTTMKLMTVLTLHIKLVMIIYEFNTVTVIKAYVTGIINRNKPQH